MIRFLLVAAALTLAACGNNRSVIEGMENETPSIPGLGAEVQEQAQTLPSGLELQFTRRGANQALAQPTINATALVHYEGSLVDTGEVFDFNPSHAVSLRSFRWRRSCPAFPRRSPICAQATR